MAIPSTMSGDVDVLNCGYAACNSFVKSLRHNTLPLAASRQETVAPSSSVTTFPSATAGDDRGPECCAAIRLTVTSVEYLSSHTGLPVATSRHWVTSSFPRRAKTYTLSPTRAGVASPTPTVAFHVRCNSLGHVS